MCYCFFWFHVDKVYQLFISNVQSFLLRCVNHIFFMTRIVTVKFRIIILHSSLHKLVKYSVWRWSNKRFFNRCLFLNRVFFFKPRLLYINFAAEFSLLMSPTPPTRTHTCAYNTPRTLNEWKKSFFKKPERK